MISEPSDLYALWSNIHLIKQVDNRSHIEASWIEEYTKKPEKIPKIKNNQLCMRRHVCAFDEFIKKVQKLVQSDEFGRAVLRLQNWTGKFGKMFLDHADQVVDATQINEKEIVMGIFVFVQKTRRLPNITQKNLKRLKAQYIRCIDKLLWTKSFEEMNFPCVINLLKLIVQKYANENNLREDIGDLYNLLFETPGKIDQQRALWLLECL